MSVTTKTAKLSTLIENLQDILEKEGDLPIVMSRDEEGNDYNTFDSTGDTPYGCEGGILILYPFSERIDLEDIDGYSYECEDDDDNNNYTSYDEDNLFDDMEYDNNDYS